MQPSNDIVNILGRRAIIEARLSALLKESHATATLDDIKHLIYNEDINERPSTYFSKLFAMFTNPRTATDIEAIAQVIQDAWNYFPHRALKGQCPAEVFARQTASEPTPKRRRKSRDREA